MTKIISKKNLFLIIFSILTLLILSTSFFNIYSVKAEDVSQETKIAKQDFVVEAYNRENKKILQDNPASFLGENAHKYEWSNLNKFMLYYVPNESSAPNPNEKGEYDMTISVEYMQVYLDSPNFQSIVLKSEKRTEKNLSAFETYRFSYIVNDWGMYKFELKINNQSITSDYYFVEPTLKVVNEPQIKHNVVSSSSSMHDSFDFYVKNANDYKYADKTKIVWYVLGEGPDGTKYALTKADLNLSAFSRCDTYLYESYDRTGTNFHFDDYGKDGKWQVWCEYQYHGSNSPISSDFINVVTGAKVNYMSIVWIVVACAVVAIGIVITISVVRSKKEKVW